MCGIAGFLGGDADSLRRGGAILEDMASAIQHRGPNDSGIWLDENLAVGLAHRRLSILDLSAAGHQPMCSESRRFKIVYNGEIYNHLEIRKSIESEKGMVSWRGHSDTETLLAGFDLWGLEKTILKTVGMFAIAVWDCETEELLLVRDRIGEKPLYFGWQNNTFLFGSELKALKRHPSFVGEIDRSSIALLFRYNYIPAPNSIYKGIFKLPPGSILAVSKKTPIPKISRYWTINSAIKAGKENHFVGTAEQAVDQLEELCTQAISRQMISDVPLGAFLSGGVDSSTVVGIMQKMSTNPVKTFSIGFDSKGHNEAEYAKAVAKHLKTDHTEMYVTANHAISVIPKIPRLYDEPFSDSSQIPTYLVSELARSKVTVSLSGDAGDELFCGYNRYDMTSKLWNRISVVPRFLRSGMSQLIRNVPPETWSRLLSNLPVASRYNNIGDKLHKGADVLGSSSIQELYEGIVSHTRRPSDLLLDFGQDDFGLDVNQIDGSGLDAVEFMMGLDMVTYLPDDILVKVDRASMGVSLETRVPFLDHNIVEFAWRLPQSFKIRDGQSKWILRQILYKYVPRELIERPKMGFGVPLDEWLRGPLRGWVEELIAPQRLRNQGFLKVDAIYKLWDEHLSGKRNWAYVLWDVLMFQAWLEEQ